MIKDKLKVLIVHLAISVLVALCLAFVVFVVWYPDPLPKATGITQIFVVMLAIDVIIGPILTFLVYKKGKKTLKMDLCIIIALQIGAMLYGMYFVAQGRPAWLVQVEDRVIMISPSFALDKNNQSIANRLSQQHWGKPNIVSVKFSNDPKIRGEQVVLDAMGQGVVYQPSSYEEYDIKSALFYAKNLDRLKHYNSVQKVNDVLTEHKTARFWLPLRGADMSEDLVALLDGQGNVVAIVDLRPWS